MHTPASFIEHSPRRLAASLCLLVLASCGGGGGGGSSSSAVPVASTGTQAPSATASQPASSAASAPAASGSASAPQTTTTTTTSTTAAAPVPMASGPIGGYVVASATHGATVTLFAVGADGTLTQLAQTTSAADGSYGFQIVPPEGAVYMVSASGGSYRDEATAADLSLSTPLRALDVWSGPSRRVSPTVYSEVAVRAIEDAATPDWTAAGVVAANNAVAESIGDAGLIDFRPVDLSNPADVASSSYLDQTMSSYVGMASSYGALIDTNPGTSLGSTIQSLTDLLLNDADDNE